MDEMNEGGWQVEAQLSVTGASGEWQNIRRGVEEEYKTRMQRLRRRLGQGAEVNNPIVVAMSAHISFLLSAGGAI